MRRASTGQPLHAKYVGENMLVVLGMKAYGKRRATLRTERMDQPLRSMGRRPSQEIPARDLKSCEVSREAQSALGAGL